MSISNTRLSNCAQRMRAGVEGRRASPWSANLSWALTGGLGRRTSGTRRATVQRDAPQAPGSCLLAWQRKAMTGDAGCWYPRTGERPPARGAPARGNGEGWRAAVLWRHQTVSSETRDVGFVGDTIKLVRRAPVRVGGIRRSPRSTAVLLSLFAASRLEGKLIEGAALRNGIRVIGVGPPRVRDLRFPTRKAPARLALRCQGAGRSPEHRSVYGLGRVGGRPLRFSLCPCYGAQAAGGGCGLWARPCLEPWARSSFALAGTPWFRIGTLKAFAAACATAARQPG